MDIQISIYPKYANLGTEPLEAIALQIQDKPVLIPSKKWDINYVIQKITS